MGVCSQRHTECSGQSKIRELEIALTVNQQVLGLQITVQDSVAVTVANAFYQLSHEFLDHSIAQAECHGCSIRKSLAAATLANRQSLHVFLQVEIKEFEDKVQFVTVCMNDVEQLDDVRVLHLLQERDLADGGTRDALIFGFETNFLQSDDTIGMIEFASFVDNTVGSYSRLDASAWFPNPGCLTCWLWLGVNNAYLHQFSQSSGSSPWWRCLSNGLYLINEAVR